MIRTVIAGLLAFLTANSASAEEPDLRKFVVKQSQMLIEGLAGREILGLEFFTVSAGNALENQLGHAGVRLVDGDPYPLNDIIISFAALTPPDGAKMYYKGVVGSYPLYPSLTVLSRELRILNADGFRSIERYPLTLSKDQLKGFVSALKEWVMHPEQSPSYTFFDKNCGFGLFYLLNQAGVTSYTQALIPTAIPESLRLSALNFYPADVSETPSTVIHRLGDSAEFASKIQKLSLKELILLTTSEKELARPYFEAVTDEVRSRVAAGETLPNLEEVYNVKAWPACVYDMNLVEGCGTKVPEEYRSQLRSIALTLKTRANLMSSRGKLEHVSKLNRHLDGPNFKLLERLSN